MFTLVCQITFRLTNSLRVSRDTVVIGVKDQVVSIALYEGLNSNLFKNKRDKVLTIKCILIIL